MIKIKVLIASKSYIILRGLNFILNEFEEVEVIWSNVEKEELLASILKARPDFALVTAEMISQQDIPELQKHLPGKTKLIYMNTETGKKLSGIYSDQIDIYKDKNSFTEQFNQLILKHLPKKQKKVNSTELSKREKIIIRHIALGLTSKEIGEKLFISTHTVITHRKNITHKLGIKTVSGQTVYAILNGIVTIEEIGV
ncbi:MAG: response regulator transcription factor [Bacteroidales bacterium]|nr:response regulator transcription factor [Bacteroidales bacterium]